MTGRVPLFALVAGLLLGVLAWLFLFSPQRDERAALADETESLRGQQQQVRLQIARLEEIKANELEVRAALARAEQFIPNGPGQAALIRQLQLAGDASGVEITAVQFADLAQVVDPAAPPPEPGTALAQIPVTVTVEAGYFQVTDFLRRIEWELPRAMLVESVSAIEAPVPARFPTLSVTLATRLFALVPPAALPPQPGQAAPPPAEGAPVEGASE